MKYQLLKLNFSWQPIEVLAINAFVNGKCVNLLLINSIAARYLMIMFAQRADFLGFRFVFVLLLVFESEIQFFSKFLTQSCFFQGILISYTLWEGRSVARGAELQCALQKEREINLKCTVRWLSCSLVDFTLILVEC